MKVTNAIARVALLEDVSQVALAEWLEVVDNGTGAEVVSVGAVEVTLGRHLPSNHVSIGTAFCGSNFVTQKLYSN